MNAAPLTPAQRVGHRLAAAGWIALLVLTVLWEWQLAPLRPGGSWLVAKALPLLALLRGVVRGAVGPMQWSTLLVLLYAAEGSVRVFEPAPVRALAILETVLAALFFVAAIVYLRPFKRAARTRRAS